MYVRIFCMSTLLIYIRIYTCRTRKYPPKSWRKITKGGSQFFQDTLRRSVECYWSGLGTHLQMGRFSALLSCLANSAGPWWHRGAAISVPSLMNPWAKPPCPQDPQPFSAWNHPNLPGPTCIAPLRRNLLLKSLEEPWRPLLQLSWIWFRLCLQTQINFRVRGTQAHMSRVSFML